MKLGGKLPSSVPRHVKKNGPSAVNGDTASDKTNTEDQTGAGQSEFQIQMSGESDKDAIMYCSGLPFIMLTVAPMSSIFMIAIDTNIIGELNPTLD